MSKKLKRGETVHVANRLYGVVDVGGMLMESWHFGPEIFTKRDEARDEVRDDERVLRLSDVSGTIV